MNYKVIADCSEGQVEILVDTDNEVQAAAEAQYISKDIRLRNCEVHKVRSEHGMC